jgi:Raf kinase inhibitor-like YbhB/YbcL family protein
MNLPIFACLFLTFAAPALQPAVQPPAQPPAAKPEAKVFTLSSPTITHNTQMPKKYTVDGENISPPLKWEHAPAGTKEFALVMDDPDAGGFVHWVLYKIPADVRELPENLPREKELAQPVGALQGKNMFRRDPIGYKGPAARKGGGVHHYKFSLYALDAELDLKPELEKKELLAAMEGHILAKAELVGTNER